MKEADMDEVFYPHDGGGSMIPVPKQEEVGDYWGEYHPASGVAIDFLVQHPEIAVALAAMITQGETI